ncbi:Uncharacterised protein [Mycobacteroides abscessus subsp. abscessus]|nr:Uncharacterised protein [Mycobacteroides abscessus subsp. abscessus]
MNYSNTYAPVGGTEATSTASQQYETGVRYVPDIFGKVTTLSAFNQIQNRRNCGCAARRWKASCSPCPAFGSWRPTW